MHPSIAALSWYLAVQGAAAHAAVPAVVSACGDHEEFPPYTYFKRIGESDIGTPVGYNVDYLTALLASEGRTLKITLVPWKRCLALAYAGQFDLVLDVADTAERRRSFTLLPSHYSTTPVYLFARARPLPAIRRPEDLQAYRRCEVRGWNYSRSGKSLPPEMGLRFSTPLAAMDMLRRGRCEFMFYNAELVRGAAMAGRDGMPEELAARPVPWVATVPMHLAVSRAVPYSGDLAAMLERGIARMKNSGEAARLLDLHSGR
jgi:polar amino acid transport system substrate-binding protein